MNEVVITVNGVQQSVPAGASVADLVRLMGLDPSHVAVERNQEVVPRASWSEAAIAAGDHIEVVTFMGGG